MKLIDLIDKIIKFAENINSKYFRPYQRKMAVNIIEAAILNKGACFTNLWSRKSGKSETIKATALALMAILPALSSTVVAQDFPKLKLYEEGFTIALAGPKLETASIPFIRLRRQARQQKFMAMLNSLSLDILTSNSRYFELSNGSVAQAFSGSESASNEGPGADFLIIDEASMLSPFSYYKILRPMVAATNGTICQAGTPWKKRCPFLHDIDLNKKKYPEYHFEVPYQEVIQYSNEYASFIDSEIDRLPGGADNPFFMMNYRLIWLIAEGHFLDSDKFMTLATSSRSSLGGDLFAGVDWGKIVSSTCITIIEDRQNKPSIIDLLEVKGPYEEQFDNFIIPFLDRHKARLKKIHAESNGVGDPLCEKLESAFPGLVAPCFMSTPFKDKIFTNLNMEITSKTPRFSYFDDGSQEAKSFIRQFMDAEQEVKGNFLCVHHSGEDGATDDFCYSTALALDAFLSTPRVPKIEHKSTGVRRSVLDVLSEF